MTAILVTRPAGAGDPLVGALEARGHHVIPVPTVETRPVAVEWPPLEEFDWIVLTSAAGVDALPRIPRGPRWAAVGAATARALRARGAEADVVPDRATGAALAEAMPAPAGARVLLVRASAAGADLPEALRRRGAKVVELTAYETVEGPVESKEALEAALASGVAVVVFASGSAARGYVNLGGSVELPAVTIGPRTSQAARDLGFTVAAEADGAEVGWLAAAVDRAVAVEGANHA